MVSYRLQLLSVIFLLLRSKQTHIYYLPGAIKEVCRLLLVFRLGDECLHDPKPTLWVLFFQYAPQFLQQITTLPYVLCPQNQFS